MKRLFLAFGLAAFALASAFGLTGNGQVRTEERKASGFRSIEMSGVGSLTVTRASSFRVTVSLDSNLLPIYESRVEGGVLHLGFKPGSVSGLTKLAVAVSLPELDALRASGTCEASIADVFKGKSLRLELSGAGAIAGRLEYQTLSVGLSGSGHVRLSGKAESLEAKVSGAGEIDAAALQSRDAVVDLSGASKLSLRASDSLSVSASGVSSVTYYGDPKIKARTSGVSSVKKGG
jgi:hypothetical protein